MLRDRAIDTAIRFGLDKPLRTIRAMLHPAYKYDRESMHAVQQLLMSTLTSTSNCIDIGAYRGRILGDILRIAPQGHHIAYEPLPHHYKALVARYPNVDIRNAAVSNEPGETTFNYVKNIPAESGMREKTYNRSVDIEKLVVRTESLDRNLPEGYVPAFIKVDVEGAERQVFEGGIETISKYKPIIMFEHGQASKAYGTTPRHIYELLHDQAGLNIFDLEGNGPYTLEQLEASYAEDSRWDYLAQP